MKHISQFDWLINDLSLECAWLTAALHGRCMRCWFLTWGLEGNVECWQGTLCCSELCTFKNIYTKTRKNCPTSSNWCWISPIGWVFFLRVSHGYWPESCLSTLKSQHFNWRTLVTSKRKYRTQYTGYIVLGGWCVQHMYQCTRYIRTHRHAPPGCPAPSLGRGCSAHKPQGKPGALAHGATLQLMWH